MRTETTTPSARAPRRSSRFTLGGSSRLALGRSSRLALGGSSRLALGLAAGLTALCGACSSPSYYADYRATLDKAEQRIDAGELSKAARDLEQFLADSYAVRAEYALQRYWAWYLLVRAHEAGAYGDAFLEEPRVGDRGGFSVEANGDENRRPSPLGHSIAVAYYGAYGRDAYTKARTKPTEVEGQKLLPPKLEALGTQDAFRHFAVSLLAVYSRLNFEERIPEIVRDLEELQDFEQCEALLARLGVHASSRPWIYRGVFDYLKSIDERTAYLFGVRARESDRESQGSMGRDILDGIADWIENESGFVFVSRMNIPFSRDFEGEDPNSGEPLIEFRAIPREQWESQNH